MQLKEIYNVADSLAPFALSGEYCRTYGGHDNSGIQLDCGGDIKKILFSLDLSLAAIEKAKEIGAKLIFTHHPALFHPLSRIETEGTGREILACAKEGISVISAHLNLDCAAGGIDEKLMQAAGGKGNVKVMHTLTAGGYGRVYDVLPFPLPAYAVKTKRTISANHSTLYESGTGKKVSRVASFCGAGMDEESVNFAFENGADTIITSDAKHHLIVAALERKMNLLLLTHYATENYGFTKFYEKFKKTADVECEYFTDARYL